MATATSSDLASPALAPRFIKQGYDSASVAQRRAWVEQQTGCDLSRVSGSVPVGIPAQGNIENPIGTIQMPLGIAGPLLVRGSHAEGTFYVPLATTEGALVRSYERGMTLLTKAGGVVTRLHRDENCVAPVFSFPGVSEAHNFASQLPLHFSAIHAAAAATTRHGQLLRITPSAEGRNVIVTFHYYTADAHGMNMILKATDAACRWIAHQFQTPGYQLFSGFESEKHASAALFDLGKGKKVTAGSEIPARLLKQYLRATPSQFVEFWHRTALGHIQAHAVGYNGHFANGLAAILIACGQDIGNLPNCAVGVTNFELTTGGDLYASVTLPSLTVATVGGGTAWGTARECLAILGCDGPGLAPRFAEIIAAALLAGELSMGGAMISGEFVASHENYGRNRPNPLGRS